MTPYPPRSILELDQDRHAEPAVVRQREPERSLAPLLFPVRPGFCSGRVRLGCDFADQFLRTEITDAV